MRVKIKFSIIPLHKYHVIYILGKNSKVVPIVEVLGLFKATMFVFAMILTFNAIRSPELHTT